jgi:hypothetical protein
MGGVVGFGEDEDVRVVCGSELFDVNNGGVEAAGVEGNEVEWVGGVVASWNKRPTAAQEVGMSSRTSWWPFESSAGRGVRSCC